MRKFFIVILVLLIFASLYYVFIYSNKSSLDSGNISKESKGDALKKMLGRKARSETKEEVGSMVYTGPYFSFAYPKAWVKRANPTEEVASFADLIEVYSLYPRITFVAQAIALSEPLSSLDEYSAVRLRNQKSSEYKEERVVIGDKVGLSYTHQGDFYEKVGFIQGQKLLYIFSATGQNKEYVDEQFQAVISTLRFK